MECVWELGDKLGRKAETERRRWADQGLGGREDLEEAEEVAEEPGGVRGPLCTGFGGSRAVASARWHEAPAPLAGPGSGHRVSGKAYSRQGEG